jgi:hypothetical protein
MSTNDAWLILIAYTQVYLQYFVNTDTRITPVLYLLNFGDFGKPYHAINSAPNKPIVGASFSELFVNAITYDDIV